MQPINTLPPSLQNPRALFLSRPVHYSMALFSVGVALLLRLLFTPFVGTTAIPFITYFPAVVFSAWVGGLGPGLFSVGLAAVSAVYLFLPPIFSMGVASPAGIWSLGTFLLSGGCIALIGETQRRTKIRAQISEQTFATTLRSIGDAVIATNKQGKITFLNSAAETMTGWNQEEALGRDLKQVFVIVNEETRQTVESPVARALREGIVVGLANHTLLVARDGTEKPIDDSAAPIRDASGYISGVILVFHDVTERKQAEQEREEMLREAQERADRDPLTRLLNHRAFQKQLEEEAARALREKTTLAVVMLDLDNFKFFNDAYGHAVGDEVLRLVAQRLEQVCRPYDIVARFGGDEFALLLPRVGQTPAVELEARLRTDIRGVCYSAGAEGIAIPITLSLGAALFSERDQNWNEVLAQADARLLRSKTGAEIETEIDRFRLKTSNSMEGFSLLDALVTAVDNKDRYTRKHSEDVLTYSLLIARELGMDEAEQQTVAVAALLHDVGKIGVPDMILRKPGRLTEAEFEAVKQHPQMGAILVSAVPGLESTLEAVRHHHERWDGKGYPLGLQAEAIPRQARIMAVADAFSAMTTDRPYRKSLTHTEAFSILQAGIGTQWDAECVGVFLRAKTKTQDVS